MCNYVVKGVAYDLLVTEATGAKPLGCVRSSDNDCPYVAFRDATAGWRMSDCRATSQCNSVFTSKTFTVPAVTSDGKLAACLTLQDDDMCPNTAVVNFPLEVFKADPANCGSADIPCVFSEDRSRTVECRQQGASCPDSYSLGLYQYTPGKLHSVTSTTCACYLRVKHAKHWLHRNAMLNKRRLSLFVANER